MAQPYTVNGITPHPAVKGIVPATPTNPALALHSSSHPGGSDDLSSAGPHRPSALAGTSSAFANSFSSPAPLKPSGVAVPQSTMNSPHQQALLLRSQQGARQGAAPPVHASSSSSVLPPDGGPPPKVPVRSIYTRVIPTEPGDTFPSISPDDQSRVKAWIERDLEYEQELLAARKGKKAEVVALGEELMTGQDWLGVQGQPGNFRIRFDDDKDREQAMKKRGVLRKPIKLSKRQLRSVATKPEVLIPIRLEIEHEAWKLRDTFTWNLLETDITPELFAGHLCADLRLPERPFVREIVTSIKKHIEDAQLSGRYDAYLGDGGASLREENRRWFDERASKRRKLQATEAERGESDDETMTLDQLPVPNTFTTEELRITIKLDITLDSIQLVDKFEWDISNPRNSPEEFAETFAAELGLTGEFRTAIAHSIREQIDTYIKSLCLLGYSRGGAIQDEDLKREFLPSVYDAFRTDNADDFTPNLNQLTPDEIDRNDKEREREVRRKRRQTKGRGVTLPDRDPVKTHRTLVPRSLPGLMAVQVDGGDMVYPMPELSLPYPIVGKPVPPKPANLESHEASPLKLLPPKDRAGGQPAGTQTLRGAALMNSLNKKGRLEAASAGDAATNGASLDSPAKTGPPRRKPPVIKPSAEELGLHEHFINGKWHCANCGVPESVAVGRRKGPTGKESLCGTCGKFYHRYKRQRPCVYTTDLETHLRYKQEEDAKANASKAKKAGDGAASTATGEGPSAVEEVRRSNRSGRGTPASQAMSPASSLHGDEDSDDSDSAPSKGGKRRRAAHYGSPDMPFVHLDSADSDSGSESEGSPPPPPQRSFNTSSANPPAPAGSSHAPQPTSAVSAEPNEPSAGPPVPAPAATPSVQPQPLPWMIAAAADLRSKQVDDRFELIPRPRPAGASVQEWRIRCLDCPGKLYNLGPGETLDGFLVHFKNRVHRGNVEARLAKERQQQ
ncbi:hypothetical protein JCM1840_000577 [Sporobolomyces johnsonii]